MSLSHTNITRKRLANIDFTVPYGWDGKGILYRTSEENRDLAQFAGKIVGIKRSSSSEGEIKAYFADRGWQTPELKQFDNHGAGIQALVDGQIDGFTDDSSIIIATAMLAGHDVGPDGKLAITSTQYSSAMLGLEYHRTSHVGVIPLAIRFMTSGVVATSKRSTTSGLGLTRYAPYHWVTTGWNPS